MVIGGGEGAFRGLKAWLQCFYHVFQPDSWLLLDTKRKYRNLSKIRSPPFFNTLHTEIIYTSPFINAEIKINCLRSKWQALLSKP